MDVGVTSVRVITNSQNFRCSKAVGENYEGNIFEN